MPLEDTDFQAGITTILEAMAMGKAVVCTPDARPDRRRRSTATTASTSRPAIPSRCARAIERLLADPAEAERLGANGRRWVEQHADLDGYVAELAALVRA